MYCVQYMYKEKRQAACDIRRNKSDYFYEGAHACVQHFYVRCSKSIIHCRTTQRHQGLLTQPIPAVSSHGANASCLHVLHFGGYHMRVPQKREHISCTHRTHTGLANNVTETEVFSYSVVGGPTTTSLLAATSSSDFTTNPNAFLFVLSTASPSNSSDYNNPTSQTE